MAKDARGLVNFEEKIGNIMRLGDWIDDVNEGMFTDYDGFGEYATEDGIIKNSFVKPSDVKHNHVQTQYEFIVWYNR
jgi:hypothetical protein